MVSLAKLVRALAFVAGFSVAGVMIAPGCVHRRCDDVRRRCDEACFYRCDRSGCYPVCEVRCRAYCYDYRNSAALQNDPDGESSGVAVLVDPSPQMPVGGRCEYDDDCSADLKCVQREGKEGRACEVSPP
jgi:hypothetical protein